MTDPRCRSNSLTDNGFSVKDRLNFWKLKEADSRPNKLLSSPKSECSPSHQNPPTPTNASSPQSKSVSTIVSSVFNFKPFLSPRHQKSTNVFSDQKEENNNDRNSNDSNVAVAATDNSNDRNTNIEVVAVPNNIDIANSATANNDDSSKLQTMVPLESSLQPQDKIINHAATCKSINIVEDVSKVARRYALSPF